MLFLRQSTESQSLLIGPFVDDTDQTTPETALSIANTDIRLSSNGGNMSSKNSGGATHDELGYYSITLNAVDTSTVGRLQLACKMAGAMIVEHTFQVVEEAVYDNLFSSSAPGPFAANSTATLVDAVWDEKLTVGSHNIGNSAGRILRNVQDFGTYALGAAWVDEVGGSSTGTVDGEDATVSNRSDDFDNAQTVAQSIGLSRIYINNGNSITLTATINNFEIGAPGSNWTLALGGQDISGCDINDANLSGIATGTDPHFHNCILGAVTIPPCEMFHCGIGATLTIGSAGTFRIVDCYSDVPGGSSPTIDFGAIGATNLMLRRWSGGLTLSNLAAGDVVSVDAVSGGTITINGTGGTVQVRGMVTVVDSSSGAVTIGQTQVINASTINAQVDTAISDASLATASALATVDSNVDTVVSGIITGQAQTGTLSTTQASTNLAGYGDDQLIGRVIIWTSGNCDGEATDITDYASGLITFTALTTIPANGDTFKIV